MTALDTSDAVLKAHGLRGAARAPSTIKGPSAGGTAPTGQVLNPTNSRSGVE